MENMDVTGQRDLFFNLLSLKNKLLIQPQECSGCHAKSQDWIVTHVCHHTICLKCKDTNKNVCPKCRLEYDEANVSSVTNMKACYTQMEEFAWRLTELELTPFLESNITGENSSSNNSSNPENVVLGNFTANGSNVLINNKAKQNTSEDSVGFNSRITNTETMTNSTNSGYKSEDDIIEGTPGKCNVFIHDSCSGMTEQTSRKIVLSYTNVGEDDIAVLYDFVKFFGIKSFKVWDDSVTHLVMKTVDDKCVRTKKYFYAILSHCYIVSLKWVKECLLSKTLLSEVDYMPNDSSGEPSPFASWRVGRNLIKPQLEWTKDCMLYFHESVQINASCSDIIIYARLAGFVLANSLEEFNEKFKMRFIIVEQPFNGSEKDIMDWLCKHKAVTLSLDWFFDCVCLYKFIPISPKYQEMPLDQKKVQLSNMDESYFVFDL